MLFARIVISTRIVISNSPRVTKFWLTSFLLTDHTYLLKRDFKNLTKQHRVVVLVAIRPGKVDLHVTVQWNFVTEKLSLYNYNLVQTGITERLLLDGSKIQVKNCNSLRISYNWMQKTIMRGNIDSGSSKNLVYGKGNLIMLINF